MELITAVAEETELSRAKASEVAFGDGAFAT